MNQRDTFWEDPRTLDLIEQLMGHYRQKIEALHSVKEGSGYLDLSDKVAQFSEDRGGALFYPYIGSGLGNGALVELIDGSVKYDFISGIGVHFGHNHPKMMYAMVQAALEDVVMQGNLQQNRISVELVAKFKEISGMDHVFLTTSGAMAAENALKLIFQHHHPAKRLLAFKNCFIGRTLTLSQVSDKPKNRVGLLDNMGVDYLPFYNPEYHQQSIDQTCKQLEAYIKRYPNQYAGMCLELIQGEGGFYPGNTEFFEAIMTILKRNQIAVYVDEIQTFGRTSQFFAYQHFGLEKWVDVVTIGKLSQVCATLFRRPYKPKPSTLSQTFTGSTNALYAALCIVNELEEQAHFGISGRNMIMRGHMVGQLEKLHEDFPELVRGPFGEGLMIAFTYKTGKKEEAITFIRTLFKNGVIAFVSGEGPTRIRFLLPVGSIDRNAIEAGCSIVRQTIKELNPHA